MIMLTLSYIISYAYWFLPRCHLHEQVNVKFTNKAFESLF